MWARLLDFEPSGKFSENVRIWPESGQPKFAYSEPSANDPDNDTDENCFSCAKIDLVYNSRGTQWGVNSMGLWEVCPLMTYIL